MSINWDSSRMASMASAIHRRSTPVFLRSIWIYCTSAAHHSGRLPTQRQFTTIETSFPLSLSLSLSLPVCVCVCVCLSLCSSGRNWILSAGIYFDNPMIRFFVNIFLPFSSSFGYCVGLTRFTVDELESFCGIDWICRKSQRLLARDLCAPYSVWNIPPRPKKCLNKRISEYQKRMTTIAAINKLNRCDAAA